MNDKKGNDMNKVILTDCDGVLLNWEYAFHIWMEQMGYEKREGCYDVYDVADKYYITKEEGKKLIKMFNQSAAMGFLPPLRDAVEYVRKLHEKGYVFHLITSMSADQNAQRLRTKNIKKLFGKTAFEKFIYLDTGADKDEELSKYKDKEYIWIEDKVENAECGDSFGLESILMEHTFNMDNKKFPLMKNWKEIYEYITAE